MSSQEKSPEEQAAYLSSLKEEARLLGVSISGNVSEETLVERIRLAKEQQATKERPETNTPKSNAPVIDEAVLKANEAKAAAEQKIREARQLRRVIVTCHDPRKAKYTAEKFSVGNSGFTETKVVKFGQPWHVPAIMIDHIKSITYTSFYEIPGEHGLKIKKSRLLPAYSVTELPPLTLEELKALDKAQKIRSNSDVV